MESYIQGSNLKFQIEKDVFFHALQRVQGIVERKSSIPMSANIKIEGRGDISKISITATDLDIGVQGLYPAKVLNSGGIVVAGKKMFEIIRELPSGDVSFEVEDRKQVIIRAGKSIFKITGFITEDYPSLPEITEERMLSTETGVFKEMIRKIFFSIPEAEARQVLNGALFEIEEGEDKLINLKMIGTDGHRLAVCGRTIKGGNASFEKREEGQQIVIPKKTLNEIRRFMDTEGEFKIGIGDKLLFFKGGDVYLTSRLIEGTYPNYKQVIPQKGEHEIQVNRLDFINAVKRVSVMSREKTKAILIEFTEGKAVLRSRDQEIGEATEEVDLNYKGPGITLGLNHQYLIEALDSMEDEDVTFNMQTNLSPCIIKQESDPDSLCIVMPMRVQEAE